MRKRFAAALLGALLAPVAPAGADYLTPRDRSDCMMNRPEYGFQSQLETIREEARRCEAAASHSGTYVSACTHLGPRTCLPVYRRTCAIQDQMASLRDQCLARDDSRRAFEAAEKKRREEQAKAEKAAAQASTFGLQLPQDLATGVRLGMGVPGGANALSDTLTRGGTAGVTAIQKRALEQMLAGMGVAGGLEAGGKVAPGRSYPRRSTRQLDEAFGILGESDRVEAIDRPLPFEQSIVASAYGSLLGQIVAAQANGEIEAPLAAIGIALATWVAYEAGMAEIEMRDQQRERAASAARDLLPRQQAIAAATRLRLAPPPPAPVPEPPLKPALTLPEPVAPPALEPTRQHGGRKLAGSCVVIERTPGTVFSNFETNPDGIGYLIKNRCPYRIAFPDPESNSTALRYEVDPGNAEGYFSRVFRDRIYISQ